MGKANNFKNAALSGLTYHVKDLSFKKLSEDRELFGWLASQLAREKKENTTRGHDDGATQGMNLKYWEGVMELATKKSKTAQVIYHYAKFEVLKKKYEVSLHEARKKELMENIRKLLWVAGKQTRQQLKQKIQKWIAQQEAVEWMEDCCAKKYERTWQQYHRDFPYGLEVDSFHTVLMESLQQKRKTLKQQLEKAHLYSEFRDWKGDSLSTIKWKSMSVEDLQKAISQMQNMLELQCSKNKACGFNWEGYLEWCKTEA